MLLLLLICPIVFLTVNKINFNVEIDTEGTITPDDDPPQEMGDGTIEVTSLNLFHLYFQCCLHYVRLLKK